MHATVTQGEAGATAGRSRDVWAAGDAAKRIGIGAVWSFGVQAISLLSGMGGTVVLVRGMSHRGYGALAIGSAVVGFLATAGGLGLGPAVARFAADRSAGENVDVVARSIARYTLRLALPIAAAIGLVCVGVAAVMQSSGRWSGAGLVVLVAMPMAILAPYQAVASGYLAATFRPALSAGITASFAICQLVLISAAVVVGLTAPYEVASIRTLVGVAGAVVLLRRISLGRFKKRNDATADFAALGRPLLGFGLAMTLTTMTGVLISQLDVFVLGLVRGTAAAGAYAPLSRLADACLMVPGALGSYLMPALAAANSRGQKDEVRSLYHWTSRWAFVVAAPFLAVLFVCPGQVIHVLFGGSFHAVGLPLRVLSVGLAIHFIFGFNGMTLDALGDARTVAQRSGLGVLVSVAACVVFVPLWGSAGAAASTATAILVLNVTCSIILSRRHGIPIGSWENLTTFLVFAAALCSAAFVSLWFDSSPWLRVITVGAMAGLPTLLASVLIDRPRRARVSAVKRGGR